MPSDRDFKRLVRQRMRERGISYTQARAELLAMSGELPLPDDTAPKLVGGDIPVHPFGRLSPESKAVLLLAQEAAEGSNSEWVGTEHALIGIARCEGTIAAEVLRAMGVNLEVVRREIESQVVPPPTAAPKRDVPVSAQLKKVVELAFEEARDSRSDWVRPEHLLLGLLRADDSVAAQALQRFGITVPVTRHLAGARSVESKRRTPTGSISAAAAGRSMPEITTLLGQARMLASARGQTLSTDHVLLVLSRMRTGHAASILADHGLTPDVLEALLSLLDDPPAA